MELSRKASRRVYAEAGRNSGIQVCGSESGKIVTVMDKCGVE
jgi:hypothetical protein